MELFWVVWTIGIIVTFGFMEARAIVTKQATLSRTVWEINKGWPLFGVVFGLLMGGLAVHFFWPGQGCGF